MTIVMRGFADATRIERFVRLDFAPLGTSAPRD